MTYPKGLPALRPGEVLVYCDDASHAREKVRVIEVYAKDARGWGAVGTVTKKSRDEARAENDARPIARADNDPRTTPLRRALPHPQRTSTGYTAGEDRHQKWDLRCSLCGLEPRWNETTASPFLDQLVSAGVRAVSLAALAARLRK